MRAVLNKLNVTAAQVIIEDKGALDCVLQARVKAAVLRATDENINWEAVL
ncbi:citrate lyase gamma chain, putative [Aggregatibacter actinomycetemcomitans HK1651]|nr:citrate lyase gamma chain, putative [Aggregatibacter actinomycetemcomitans HK1651]